MNENDLIAEFNGILLDPIVQTKLRKIEEIAGFRLSDEQRQHIHRFHLMHINNAYPRHIQKLKTDYPGRFQQVLQGILGDVEQALAGVYYHRHNLATTEAKMYAEINDRDFLDRLKTTTVSIGNTAILDFEYHSLILAARRCLDYLARAVGACFCLDVSSFRKLLAIKQSHPKQIVEALIEVYEARLPLLGRLVSAQSEKSMRDVIAHYKFIDVGALNISRDWFRLFGGPENLNKNFHRNAKQLLIEPIDQLCSDVQQTIDQVLATLFQQSDPRAHD